MKLSTIPFVYIRLMLIDEMLVRISTATSRVRQRRAATVSGAAGATGAATSRNDAAAAHDPQCADACTAEMQKLIESTPFFTSSNANSPANRTGIELTRNSFFRAGLPGASFSAQATRQAKIAKNHENIMSKFFTVICDSYEKVDVCLTKCESQEILKSKDSYLNYHSNFWMENGADETEAAAQNGRATAARAANNNNGITMNLRQVYAGLQFICKERRADFFDALPCLSEYEPNAMLKCSEEINRSQETTLLFTNSIVNREFHNIQLRFGTLCRDLNVMMMCMEPTIRRGCGDQPTNLMLSFIGLEFSSFEKLNEQLGFDQPLPASCRQLIQYSYERRLKQSSSSVRARQNAADARRQQHQQHREQQELLLRQNFNLSVGGARRRIGGGALPRFAAILAVALLAIPTISKRLLYYCNI